MPAAYPARQLGQHADCRDVERIVLEVRFQQPLGDIEAVVIQCRTRLNKARMMFGCRLALHSPEPSLHGALAPSRSRRYSRAMIYFEDLQLGVEEHYGSYE